MTKRLMEANRFDWRLGLNTSVNPDELQPNELLLAQNVRLTAVYGALAKRSGCRKTHETALGAPTSVDGVYEWDGPSGKQIVAVSNGDLFYKNLSAGEYSAFSTTSPTPVIGGGPISFQEFRDTSASAALVLYFCDSSGEYWKWTGSVLTNIDKDTTPVVPQGVMTKAYHTRMFTVDQRYLKALWWSKIGTGADYDSGDAVDGGTATVDILTGESIKALEVIGSSLAIATDDSISRFTGYSVDDIRLDQDVEGISSTVGAMGQLAFRRVEDYIVCVSDRGVYAITESDAKPIGMKIEAEFDGLARAYLGNAVVCYHRGRREVWVAVTPSGQTTNKHVYVFSTRLGAWSGPFIYTFGINDMCRYEDASGDEYIIAAATDGFIYHMDTGAKDGVLFDASGGSNIAMTVELAPIFFDNGPNMLKSLKQIIVQADVHASGSLVVKHAFDGNSLTTETGFAGTAGTVLPKRVDLSGQGGRLRLQFYDVSAYIPVIHGLMVSAWDLERPSA